MTYRAAHPHGPATPRRPFAPLLALLALAGLVAALELAAPASASASACKYKRMRPSHGTEYRASRAVACLINRRRRRHGLAPLRLRKPIRRAAHRHSRYMTRQNCFSHQCYGEPSLATRIASTGYFKGANSWGCGETIDWGKYRRGTPIRIVKRWMHSSEHRAIMLSGRWETFGVGVVWGSPAGRSKHAGTYTADFAYRSG